MIVTIVKPSQKFFQFWYDRALRGRLDKFPDRGQKNGFLRLIQLCMFSAQRRRWLGKFRWKTATDCTRTMLGLHTFLFSLFSRFRCSIPVFPSLEGKKELTYLEDEDILMMWENVFSKRVDRSDGWERHLAILGPNQVRSKDNSQIWRSHLVQIAPILYLEQSWGKERSELCL